MPKQDAERASDGSATPDRPRLGLSRRSLLRRAGAAGAAGLAVTAIGASPALAATAKPAGTSTSKASTSKAGASAGNSAGDSIVVHVRDARTGDIEVFSGTTQTRVRDRDLAARIAQALR
jgi:hypothetical protein